MRGVEIQAGVWCTLAYNLPQCALCGINDESGSTSEMMIRETAASFNRRVRCYPEVLLIAVLLALSPRVSAQQKELPGVFEAVAPEWPALNNADAYKPQTKTVLIQVTVDGFGNVVEQKLLTPKSTYSNSAMKAASLWKFEPPCTNLDENINGLMMTLKFTFRTLPVNASPDELGTTFVTPYEIQLSRRVLER
jgi:hypothetical protein